MAIAWMCVRVRARLCICLWLLDRGRSAGRQEWWGVHHPLVILFSLFISKPLDPTPNILKVVYTCRLCSSVAERTRDRSEMDPHQLVSFYQKNHTIQQYSEIALTLTKQPRTKHLIS